MHSHLRSLLGGDLQDLTACGVMQLACFLEAQLAWLLHAFWAPVAQEDSGARGWPGVQQAVSNVHPDLARLVYSGHPLRTCPVATLAHKLRRLPCNGASAASSHAAVCQQALATVLPATTV